MTDNTANFMSLQARCMVKYDHSNACLVAKVTDNVVVSKEDGL